MAGNGYGNHQMSRAKIMQEHDLLPKEGRFLGAYLTAKWSAGSIKGALLAAWPQPSKRAEVAYARKLLSEEEGKDTWRDYGPLHPECPEHLKCKRPPKGAWWAKGMRHGRA